MLLLLLPVALALVGNLATNTVEVSWRWWPYLVWAVAGLLIAAIAIVEVVRHRASRTVAGADPSGATRVPISVFGAIPLPAQHFQPRPVETDELSRALGDEGRAALAALPGARGAGKSQLAAVYARRCVEDGYDLVAWINAESGPVADLALLAQGLGLRGLDQPPQVLAGAACLWLQGQARGRRLLVFDNVDNPDSIRPFLPRSGSTKVIVTTNRAEFAGMAGFRVVAVGMFSPEQGQAFLHAATHLAAGADAAAVGEELGWLPLGLAQAGAYIAGNRLSYGQYLQALASQDLGSLLRRRLGFDHPGVLKATALSVAGLGREDPSGDAVRVLTVLAVLSPDGVSRALLAKAQSALELAGMLGAALDVLAGASLITLSGMPDAGQGRDGVVVMVHRLTARVIRHQAAWPGAVVSLRDATTVATGLIDELTRDLPQAQVARRRAELAELVAHILTVREHTSDPLPLLLTQADWAGLALGEAGDLTRAMYLLEQTMADRQRVLGADHPDTLATRHHLIYWQGAAGDPAGAASAFADLLADRLRVLGADHPDTLTTRYLLAHWRGAAGDPAGAATALADLLTEQLRLLGPDHPHTLTTRHHLISWRGWHGAIGDTTPATASNAAIAYAELLIDRLRVLGPDHPDTLDTRHNLAFWQGEAGDPAGAATAFADLLTDRLRLLGPEHPATLATREDLASCRGEAGDPAGAAIALADLLTDKLRVLGPDHPDTQDTRHELAYWRGKAGDPASATTAPTKQLTRVRMNRPDHL